jgi:hypothetical protein
MPRTMAAHLTQIAYEREIVLVLAERNPLGLPKYLLWFIWLPSQTVPSPNFRSACAMRSLAMVSACF